MRCASLIALGIAVLATSGQAMAQTADLVPRSGNEQPSFDCATAKTAAARLICADQELTQADRRLAATFQKQKLQVYLPDQSKFIRDELAWIRDRNERCGLAGKNGAAIEVLANSKSCLLTALQERVAVLGDVELRPPVGQNMDQPSQTVLSPGAQFPAQAQTIWPTPSQSVPLSPSVREAQAPIIQTSCHMDHCFWFRLKAKTTVLSRLSGDLVKVLSDQGESFHPNGSYEKSQPINWKKTPVESYVFCSKEQPADIDQDGDHWLVTLLAPGDPDANPGSARDAYIVYFLICHDRNFSEMVVSDEDVASFGYPASLAGQAGEQVKLVAPTDIIKFTNTSAAQDPKQAEALLSSNPAMRALDGIVDTMANLDSKQLTSTLNVMVSPNARVAEDADSKLYGVLGNCAASAVNGGDRSNVKMLRSDCADEYIAWFPTCLQTGQSPNACAATALLLTRMAIEGSDKYCVGATAEDAARFECAGKSSTPKDISALSNSDGKSIAVVIAIIIGIAFASPAFRKLCIALPILALCLWVSYRSLGELINKDQPSETFLDNIHKNLHALSLHLKEIQSDLKADIARRDDVRAR